MKSNLLKALFFMLISNSVVANITLPNFFSDNMVLQRNADVKFWGWANPNEEIKITPSWNNVEYKAKTNNQAQWELIIPTPKEGGPYSILIKGYNEVTLKNILLGEVWLCSGQSNMEMSVAWGIENGEEEAKLANSPNIRFFTVPKATATSPQNNLHGDWAMCTPETMPNFSAVAYFFAKRLQEDLKNVPIGLICSAWGGTPAEIWIPEDVIKNNPILLEGAKKLIEEQWGPSQPGRAYNAMIHPLVGFKIAGTIWYQGETNVGATTYNKTFEALIATWRKLWTTDFPFYFAQIAPFKYGDETGGAIIRDAQRRTLQNVANTGMAMTSDISTTDDIHPKNKKTVGLRLANLVLANVYKTNSDLVNGPLYKGIKIEKDKIAVTFDYAEELHFKKIKNNQFEIAGSDGIFHEADATIKKGIVFLKSQKVKKPITVRFAWKSTSQSELFNKAGLPASCFISEL